MTLPRLAVRRRPRPGLSGRSPCSATLGGGIRWPGSAAARRPGWRLARYADRRARRGRTTSRSWSARPSALGVALERAGPPASGGAVLLTAAATWAVLGGRSLRREAMTIADQLAAGDLPRRARQVRNLVGRDTAELSAERDGPGHRRVGGREHLRRGGRPAVLGRGCRRPGLLGYRAVNTLDAMIGHRSPRYLRFGWAAARLDDVANWVPARLAGLAAAAWRPAGRRLASRRWAPSRRDAGQHPSPNAGVVEAAFAGALGLRLGGAQRLPGPGRGPRRARRRPPVGDRDDIARANRLAAAVSVASAGLLVAVCVRMVRPMTVLILGGTAEARIWPPRWWRPERTC